MNNAYCPQCGETRYDMNHRCMNGCGSMVWLDKNEQQNAEKAAETLKTPLPEIIESMNKEE